MRAYRVPLLGFAVALVVVVLWWFLLYRPLDDRLAQVHIETDALLQQQQGLRGQIAALRAIEADEVEIRAALARLDEFIPSSPAQPEAIRQLQRAADRAGVEITALTFGAPEVPAPVEGTSPLDTGDAETTLANIPLTTTVEGGYFQVVDFLRRVEVEVPRAILVDSVDLAEAPAGGFPTLSASVAGQMFALVPIDDLDELEAGGAAPGAGAPAPAPSPGASPSPEPSAGAGGGAGGDDA